MFFAFKSFIKQYKLYKSFQYTAEILKNIEKEEALKEFTLLLNREPDNHYVKRQVILLKAQLNRKNDLPVWQKRNIP